MFKWDIVHDWFLESRFIYSSVTSTKGQGHTDIQGHWTRLILCPCYI